MSFTKRQRKLNALEKQRAIRRKIMRNEQFIKRLKSFLWRGSVVALIAFLNFVVENISGLGLPIWAVGLVGLIGGEISKWLNTGRKKIMPV